LPIRSRRKPTSTARWRRPQKQFRSTLSKDHPFHDSPVPSAGARPSPAGRPAMRRRHALAAIAAVPVAFASPFAALAQAKPLRFVVPYPPGGPLDIVARSLAEKVKDSLGTVIVENRPGAGGNL